MIRLGESPIAIGFYRRTRRPAVLPTRDAAIRNLPALSSPSARCRVRDRRWDLQRLKRRRRIECNGFFLNSSRRWDLVHRRGPYFGRIDQGFDEVVDRRTPHARPMLLEAQFSLALGHGAAPVPALNGAGAR